MCLRYRKKGDLLYNTALVKVWIFGNLMQPVLNIFYELPPGFESLSQNRVRKVVFTIWQFFFRFCEEKENELLCMISVVNFLKSRDFAIFVAAIFLGVFKFCCWYSSIFLSWPCFPQETKRFESACCDSKTTQLMHWSLWLVSTHLNTTSIWILYREL